jgi:hypothetical protein
VHLNGRHGGAGIQRPLSIFSRAAVAMNADRVSPRARAAPSIASSKPASIDKFAFAARPASILFCFPDRRLSLARGGPIGYRHAQPLKDSPPLPMFGNIVLIERPLITCLLQHASPPKRTSSAPFVSRPPLKRSRGCARQRTFFSDAYPEPLVIMAAHVIWLWLRT